MSDYKTLLQKRTELDRQIEAARQSEVSIALKKVRAMVADYELTQEDIFGKKKSGKVGQTVAPKYRDNATGATWAGRGKPPRWLNGKNRDDYLITSADGRSCQLQYSLKRG